MVSSEGMWFGRLAYEAPLGAHGLRIGAGVSRVSYELGGAFEILDAVGTADIYDVSLTYPLIRQRSHNLFLRGFADRKDLTDELRIVDFKTDKRVDGFGVRSEEHTSELQSLMRISYAVFCLKKKIKKQKN